MTKIPCTGDIRLKVTKWLMKFKLPKIQNILTVDDVTVKEKKSLSAHGRLFSTIQHINKRCLSASVVTPDAVKKAFASDYL